jgi:hypothetical protein
MNASSCIYTSPYMAPQALHSERDGYLTQLDSWSSAFLPVLNRLRQTASNLKEITGALLLHMYAISARIAILGTLITGMHLRLVSSRISKDSRSRLGSIPKSSTTYDKSGCIPLPSQHCPTCVWNIVKMPRFWSWP